MGEARERVLAEGAWPRVDVVLPPGAQVAYAVGGDVNERPIVLPLGVEVCGCEE